MDNFIKQLNSIDGEIIIIYQKGAVDRVDINRVQTIKGIFHDTLLISHEIYGIKKKEIISVCHINSYVYKAVKLALNFIKSAFMHGAIILFNEYHVFGADPNKGERKTVNEWLKENPDIYLERYRDYTAFARAFIFRET